MLSKLKFTQVYAHLDQLLLCPDWINLQGMHRSESCYFVETGKVFLM